MVPWASPQKEHFLHRTACRPRLEALESRDTPTAGVLRIVCYNVTADTGAPRAGLDVLLQAMGDEVVAGRSGPVDVFALQEVESQATTSQDVVNLLNGIYGAGTYARGTLDGNSTGAGTQGIVYNTTELQLIGEAAIGTASTSGQPRQTMRYRLRPLGQSAAADFYLYNSHAKADTDTTSQHRRLVEANAIRADADALGNGVAILYVGDFNTYTSDEAGFQQFLSAGPGQAFDPVNRPGNWSNTASFRDIFTQAPAVNPPAGLTGGGLDDRFDFILQSNELTDGLGLEYAAGSYHTFGNNGSVPVNGNINSASNTALPGLPNRTQALNLLTTVADHLPVVADFLLLSPQVTEVEANAGQSDVVQRSRVTSLTVTFNAQVTFAGPVADAFTVTRIGGADVGSFSATAAAVNGVTVVTLTGFAGAETEFGSLADGRYAVVVRANQVSSGGLSLDGDGNALGGDDYLLTGSVANGLYRLFGDANGDGTVNAFDLAQLRPAFGSSQGDAAYRDWLDVNGDGVVNAFDFSQFRNRFGATVP